MNNDDIFSATSICRWFSVLYGFATYNARGPAKMRQVVICYPLYAIAFTLQIVVVLFCLIFYNLRFDILYKHAANETMPLLNVIFAYVDVGHFCFIILFEKLHTSMTVKCWNMMQTMENELCRAGITLNYSWLKKWTMQVTLSEFTATNLAYAVFVVASSWLPFFHEMVYWLISLSFYYTGAANSIMLCNVIVAYGVIMHMFERLKAYTENELVWDIKKVSRISKHHHRLCELAGKLNRIYSFELLSMYVQLLIIFTIRGFDTALLFIKMELNFGMTLTVLFTLFMAVRCIFLIHVMHICMAQVRRREDIFDQCITV